MSTGIVAVVAVPLVISPSGTVIHTWGTWRRLRRISARQVLRAPELPEQTPQRLIMRRSGDDGPGWCRGSR